MGFLCDIILQVNNEFGDFHEGKSSYGNNVPNRAKGFICRKRLQSPVA